MSRQGTPQQRLQAGPVLLLALVAGLLLTPVNAAAAERVGRVLVAVGSVTAEQEDAAARRLGRRDPIYAGDRIRTAARGRVQIRFEDGAMVDLDPGSTFEVEEYASEDEDGGGSAVMSFLQGAMRTITGAIGSSSDDNYRMNTTVATIGVRGTAYALEYCDAECAEGDADEGLYGRVDDGEVGVDAPGGTAGFGEGQYFFVAEDGAPERIVAPPDGILGGDGGTGVGGGDLSGGLGIRSLPTGGDDGLGLDTDLLDPVFESAEGGRIGETVDALFAGAYVGDGVGFSVYESPFDGDVRVDEQGRVVGAEFGSDFIEAGNLTELEFETVSVQGLDVTWGSWTGADRPLADGEIAGFTYMLTDPNNITTPDQLGALDGTFSFSAAGGPSAVDNDGGVWSVQSVSMNVDFTLGAVESASISVAKDNTNILLTGGSADLSSDGSFAVSNLQEVELSRYTGGIEGRFIGTDANGALVAFEVREINGARRIVGSQILENDGLVR